MTAEKLQSCPFCGSENITPTYSDDTGNCWMVCKECMTEGPVASSEKWARIHWNDQKATLRVQELEAEVTRLKEWQEKAMPWLVDAKEFTDSSISKCPQIIQMADDRQRKMIADLPTLIAQAQGGER